jgi:hypothetical protein
LAFKFLLRFGQIQKCCVIVRIHQNIRITAHTASTLGKPKVCQVRLFKVHLPLCEGLIEDGKVGQIPDFWRICGAAIRCEPCDVNGFDAVSRGDRG